MAKPLFLTSNLHQIPTKIIITSHSKIGEEVVAYFKLKKEHIIDENPKITTSIPSLQETSMDNANSSSGNLKMEYDKKNNANKKRQFINE